MFACTIFCSLYILLSVLYYLNLCIPKIILLEIKFDSETHTFSPDAVMLLFAVLRNYNCCKSFLFFLVGFKTD